MEPAGYINARFAEKPSTIAMAPGCRSGRSPLWINTIHRVLVIIAEMALEVKSVNNEQNTASATINTGTDIPLSSGSNVVLMAWAIPTSSLVKALPSSILAATGKQQVHGTAFFSISVISASGFPRYCTMQSTTVPAMAGPTTPNCPSSSAACGAMPESTVGASQSKITTI